MEDICDLYKNKNESFGIGSGVITKEQQEEYLKSHERWCETMSEIQQYQYSQYVKEFKKVNKGNKKNE